MGAVPLPVVLYLLVTSLYAGFQWTVQVVVYRQFPEVPAEAFPRYEGLHQRRITYLVGPLFGGLVLSTGWLGLDRPPTVPGWAPAVAAALLAALAPLPSWRCRSTGGVVSPGTRRPTARCCAPT